MSLDPGDCRAQSGFTSRGPGKGRSSSGVRALKPLLLANYWSCPDTSFRVWLHFHVVHSTRINKAAALSA